MGSHISIQDFKRLVSQLFHSEEYDYYFASAIHYLIEHRLLLRSYDQEQKDTVGLTRQVVEQIENVYLPRLAIDLWNRLNSTSVFLEMFIDDIWISDDFRTSPKQQFRGFDIENYDMLCEKEQWIKDNRHHDELRKLYLDKKNKNSDLRKHSRSLYAEAVHEICQRYGFYD